MTDTHCPQRKSTGRVAIRIGRRCAMVARTGGAAMAHPRRSRCTPQRPHQGDRALHRNIAGNAQHNVRPNLDHDNSGGNRRRRCVHRIGIRGERQGNKRWLRRERLWTGQHAHKMRRQCQPPLTGMAAPVRKMMGQEIIPPGHIRNPHPRCNVSIGCSRAETGDGGGCDAARSSGDNP